MLTCPVGSNTLQLAFRVTTVNANQKGHWQARVLQEDVNVLWEQEIEGENASSFCTEDRSCTSEKLYSLAAMIVPTDFNAMDE